MWLKSHVTLQVEVLMLSHHPDRFGDHRHCVSGDVTVLVFHMISEDHQKGHVTLFVGVCHGKSLPYKVCWS